MAHSLSAKKRTRQNLKRKLHKQAIKSGIKSQLKKTRVMIAAKGNESEKTTAKEITAKEAKKTITLLDKAVSKGIMHKNKAARLKSRLALAVNKL